MTTGVLTPNPFYAADVGHIELPQPPVPGATLVSLHPDFPHQLFNYEVGEKMEKKNQISSEDIIRGVHLDEGER